MQTTITTAPAQTTTADFRAVPLQETNACFACYIPALHESVKEALNIVGEYRDSNVFSLHSDYREESEWETNNSGRFAVARPVAREDWHTIAPGTVILYVAKWVPSEKDAAQGSQVCYTTQVGPLALFDDKRGVLYAASWHNTNGENTPEDYEASHVFEMHVVEEFIEM